MVAEKHVKTCNYTVCHMVPEKRVKTCSYNGLPHGGREARQASAVHDLQAGAHDEDHPGPPLRARSRSPTRSPAACPKVVCKQVPVQVCCPVLLRAVRPSRAAAAAANAKIECEGLLLTYQEKVWSTSAARSTLDRAAVFIAVPGEDCYNVAAMLQWMPVSANSRRPPTCCWSMTIRSTASPSRKRIAEAGLPCSLTIVHSLKRESGWRTASTWPSSLIHWWTVLRSTCYRSWSNSFDHSPRRAANARRSRPRRGQPLSGQRWRVCISAPVTCGHRFHLLFRLRTQAELLSEERYRLLFNAMTEGFALHEIVCDETGRPCDYRFLDVNPAFERLHGCPRMWSANESGKAFLERMSSGFRPTAWWPWRSPASFNIARHFPVVIGGCMPIVPLRQFAVLFSDITASGG